MHIYPRGILLLIRASRLRPPRSLFPIRSTTTSGNSIGLLCSKSSFTQKLRKTKTFFSSFFSEDPEGKALGLFASRSSLQQLFPSTFDAGCSLPLHPLIFVPVLVIDREGCLRSFARPLTYLSHVARTAASVGGEALFRSDAEKPVPGGEKSDLSEEREDTMHAQTGFMWVRRYL